VSTARPADVDHGLPDLDEPIGDMAAYTRRKHRLLGSLTGTVLEVGAGRGANFGLLPAGVTWIGLEPDRRLHERLARAAAAHGRRPSILDAPAEEIPLPDRSVDAVLSTVVLCSVADPGRALAEIRRVLRRPGRFLFFEHVAAPSGTWARRSQRVWAGVSRLCGDGCDPSRETWKAIDRAGWEDVDLRWFASGRRLAVHGPYIAGQAAIH
jgi:ubiquinone/menaquinone biosynthesis C-methylase UbiE